MSEEKFDFIPSRRGDLTRSLKSIEVGETKRYPAELVTTLRSMVGVLGFQWGREFKTSCDKENRAVEVYRLS